MPDDFDFRSTPYLGLVSVIAMPAGVASDKGRQIVNG